MLFWLKNRQDILVGMFCMLLIFFAVKNLYANLSLPANSDMAWAGWMAVVIAASIGLGAAINKIAVREQKTSQLPERDIKNKAKKPKNE